MEGFPLSRFDNYDVSSCNDNMNSLDIYSNAESIMNNLGNIKCVSWLPIITMKEELIDHMKDDFNNDINLNEEEESYLERTSNEMIKFIEKFKNQLNKMNEAEEEMKHAIQENKKDIDVLSTFISFLDNVNKKCSQDTKPIEKNIRNICDDIKDNNLIKEYKNKYILEKKKFHKYLNIIKLFNQMNVGSTCSICLCENVTSYFNPCGHTACINCIERYHDKNCPLCRSYIQSVHKLYFT